MQRSLATAAGLLWPTMTSSWLAHASSSLALQIIVPTSDTVRYTYLIDRLLAAGKHVLCVGETGTGKTLNVANKLLNDMPPEVLPVFMTFSARTSANQTQDIIDAKMDKRRKVGWCRIGSGGGGRVCA